MNGQEGHEQTLQIADHREEWKPHERPPRAGYRSVTLENGKQPLLGGNKGSPCGRLVGCKRAQLPRQTARRRLRNGDRGAVRPSNPRRALTQRA